MCAVSRLAEIPNTVKALEASLRARGIAYNWGLRPRRCWAVPVPCSPATEASGRGVALIDLIANGITINIPMS